VIVPICDNVVGWLGTTGVLAALRRRAIEGGSYRVTVSLTRTVLWILSLGIFDKAYPKATAYPDSADRFLARLTSAGGGFGEPVRLLLRRERESQDSLKFRC
jgi:crotonobetainyl-CoA:carnitine CoA-transferase CaiB-like acyl-CoA transferase